MIKVEKQITYELDPEEADGTILAREALKEFQDGWKPLKVPEKHEMLFDANYNRYYATVRYFRDSYQIRI